MPIYTIAEYRVRKSGIDKVKRAIQELGINPEKANPAVS